MRGEPRKNLFITVITCFFLLLSVSLSQAQEKVKPGDVIDSGNWEKAVDVVAPAIIEMLKTHGLVIHVGESKQYPPQKEYNEATKKNLGTAKLENALWDYKAGRPFPDIDPKDPKAGLKVAWNFQYRCYPEEYYYSVCDWNWVNKSGTLERRAITEWRRLLYTGRVINDPKPEIPNTEGILFKEFLWATQPQDIAGVGFFSITYKSEKRDSDNWAYVPSLRRVRRVSGGIRTDPYLGTDAIIEDFQGFSGKVTEFDWKYIGRKKMLFMRNAGYQPVRFGGPRYKWCPLDVPWELRDAIIIDGYSLSKSHPYSKRRIYIDAEFYDNLYTETFDRKGNPWKIWLPSHYYQKEYNWFTMAGVVSIDFQALHATPVPCTIDLSSRMGPEWYTVDRLEKLGH